MALFPIRPNAIGNYNTWTLAAGASKPAAVDPGDPIVHDNEGSYITKGINPGAGNTHQSFGLGTRPIVTSVTALLYRIVGLTVGTAVESLFVFARINSADGVPSAFVPAEDTYAEFSGALARPGGGNWTVEDIANVTLEIGVLVNTNSVRAFNVTSLWLVVDGIAAPAKIEAARHRASSQIRLHRRPPQLHSAQLPPYYADQAPFSHPAWSHYAIPTTADRGAGMVNLYERRVTTRIGWKLSLNGKPHFKPRDFDLRDYSVRLWRTWHSREVPSNQRQGVAALDPGAGELYVRSGTAWIENPAAAQAGILQVVKISADVQRLATEGLLVEPQRTNDALRSSYKDGLTGITTGGASTITADTAAEHLLFEVGESPNSLKFVAGNPHSSDGTASHPVTAAYAANDRIVVSYYHKDDGGEAMAIRILRSGGGSNYWNDSTGAWAAGPINNLMPVSATKYARWISKVIDVGSGTPTITVTIVQPSGGTVGRVNRGGHLQIEKGRSATSPIITQAATVTRNRDDFKIENFTGKLVYDPARVDLDLVSVPNWNSSEQDSSAVFEYWRAFKDASNYDALFYSVATGAFVFRRRIAAVNTDATFATAVTRDTAYTLGVRAISSDGEEGMAAHTTSIFVNGVKGTDAAPGATWALAASEYLYLGQTEAGANSADGHLRQLTSRPFILSDAEHVDYP